MKKILSLFMLVMCFAVGANAQITHTISNGVLTISGTGAMPNYVKGGAPWYGQSFTTVVIEAGVTSIGNYAFQDCFDLECIYYYGNSDLTSSAQKRKLIFLGIDGYGDIVVYTLPGAASWSGLGNADFYFEGNEILWTRCNDVLSVKSNNAYRNGNFVMPAAFVDYLSEVSVIELDGANQLTVNNGLLLADGGSKLLLAADNEVITIPSTVTSIGDYALYGAISMITLYSLPVSAPTLGDNVFYDVDGFLFQNVNLYLTNLYELGGYSAWTREYNFRSVNMGTPSNSGSWSGTSLKWTVSGTTLTINGNGEIPNGQDFVNNWKALGVKSVVIKDGVTKIGESVFANLFANLSAASFTIPASVTTIGANAFYGNGSATYNFKSNLDLENTKISSDATLNLQLTDKVDLAANENTFKNVTLNRTFAAGATGTMILPFNATAPRGFKLYTIESYNNKVLTFADNGNAVQANTPYIYKNDSGSSWTPTANNVTLGNFEDMYEYSADGWTMCGVYQSKTVKNTDADEASTLWVYTTSEGKDSNGFGKFKNYAKSVTVSPYRVFFKGIPYNEVYNSSNTVNSYAPERSLSVEFVDMDGTTSITEIIIDKDGNISSAAEDGAYYDLSGRRVENPTTGIYIVNGKKVLVK